MAWARAIASSLRRKPRWLSLRSPWYQVRMVPNRSRLSLGAKFLKFEPPPSKNHQGRYLLRTRSSFRPPRIRRRGESSRTRWAWTRARATRPMRIRILKRGMRRRRGR